MSESLHLQLESNLERALSISAGEDVEVVGIGSSISIAAIAASVSAQNVHQHSNVFLFPTEESAKKFLREIALFDSSLKPAFLPAFDVSPYSGLYPSPRCLSQRLQWLTQAQTQKGLYVASIESLSQKTLPPEALADSLHSFQVGDELPHDFFGWLGSHGYSNVPTVSEAGQFASRGGILDIYSPAQNSPVRMELFGDVIDSMRLFDVESQRSLDSISSLVIAPPREVIFEEEGHLGIYEKLAQDFEEREVDPSEGREILHALRQKTYFHGVDFLLPLLHETLSLPTDHFMDPFHLWIFDPLECARHLDQRRATLKEEYELSQDLLLRPGLNSLHQWDLETCLSNERAQKISLSKVHLSDGISAKEADPIEHSSSAQNWHQAVDPKSPKLEPSRQTKINQWLESGFSVFIFSTSSSQKERLLQLFESSEFHLNDSTKEDRQWSSWREEQKTLFLIEGFLPESTILNDEKVVFLKSEDFIGRRRTAKKSSDREKFQKQASALSFGELAEGDLVVHSEHGVGVYEGLEMMEVGGAASEFIKLSYKDGDRLFLPIYRVGQIQKYSGPNSGRLLDKLGGQSWKNVKTKVSRRLKDVAAELLQLYAKRSQVTRPSFPLEDQDFVSFANSFPFEETEDQQNAIDSVMQDLESEKPMDRLICGDVGFGKTEVAMRAAFKAVQGKKQVAVLAPTTVLTFQHFENFKKRFKDWPVKIRSLNRFLSRKEVKETIEGLKDGSVDIVIGTHRLLSKDISFKDLGLLIIDEEQKFGVSHKEKIRRLKSSVDTLAMSATPIPRTLDMSLLNIRDLSLINTAPVDRLPTRTFVCKPSEETVRKAIQAEVDRGGQVFYLHNRVQSIYSISDELRAMLPHLRIQVAHGQMNEEELEKVMVSFLHHQVDVLVCTTIIESGMDIPRANTMFIDRANALGLSQLYQLRGRVGRSKERAYCYLLLPKSGQIDKQAQERLKIIQENTALGSGIRIAQYDLELRGSGNFLGEDQSGHINAVGYEMYSELLEEAIGEVKGEPRAEQIEPEINVRIPAFIPDDYIKDIRTRLSYYKLLSQITEIGDIDRIEDDLRDQFGTPPEAAVNLMGLMLIRLLCKKLGVRDLSSGPKSVALAFTEQTPLPPEQVIALTSRENKKYSFTPDNRLRIRMNDVRWMLIYDELSYLEKLCSPGAR